MLLSHREYYRDRLTEYELCQDFPCDEILIDGLYSMQSHFYNNGVNITIPVVRVMNTAHWLAAYMFSTECSGDQMEYEVMASISCGHDRKLAVVAMIVLAAMLKRTKGFRAMQCRNVILDNRPPDFEEGVTLYDRFLRSAEKHFAEENFLIDTHAQIQQLQAENTRLISENITLKYSLTQMEEKYQQINIGTQNVNYGTINNYYSTTTTATTEPAATPEPPEMEMFKYIHPCVTDVEERVKIHREVQNLVRTLPLPDVCKYLQNLKRNNRVYLNVKPELMFAELHRLGLPGEDTPGFSYKNFTNYFNIGD